MKLNELDTPVLLIDQDALGHNLNAMKEIVSNSGITYRPHAKAHKSHDIAKLQLAHGASGICCAKLGEAEVLASEGIQDILITTPVIGLSKVSRLASLAKKTSVIVVADNPQNLEELALVGEKTGQIFNLVIEVNVGQNRCGTPPGAPALALAQMIQRSPWLKLCGLQGYQGSIQMRESFTERKTEAQKASFLLRETAKLIESNGINVPSLTGGGTGTSLIDSEANLLTEIQPGGYIFMDVKYRKIEWSNSTPLPFQQSLTVLGSVISLPDTNRAILDVGLKSISSDQGPPELMDMPGITFRFSGEEHGEVSWQDSPRLCQYGDKVRLIPTHCDTTVNLYDQYIVHSGNTVVDVWRISARGRSQ
ncbi:MAG: DSD1 family PLP-dependent enzyme [Rhodospirillaceae bacterium]